MSNVTILPIAMIPSLPMDGRAVYSCLVQAACKDKGEIHLADLAAELAIKRERLDECLGELEGSGILEPIERKWSEVSSIELGSVVVSACVAQLVLGPVDDRLEMSIYVEGSDKDLELVWDRHWLKEGDPMDRLTFHPKSDDPEIELIDSSRCPEWPEGVAEVAREVYEHVVRNREPVHANGQAVGAAEPAKAGKR